MNGRMKFLFLLLTVTDWTQQSDSDSDPLEMSGYSGCPDSTGTPEYVSDKMTMEISFQGCNLSVNTTAQCSMDIKMGNISCQDDDLSTTVTTTAATITSTIYHTETVNALATVSICPTTSTSSSSLNKASHLLSSTCPLCTQNTVITTIINQKQPPTAVLSNMIPSCPACRSSTVTVTTTIYQQSSIVLSNEVEIGILTTSVVLICLPVLTLVIVTYCWIRTRRVLKKKRGDPEMKFVYLAQDSFPKSLSVHSKEDTETVKEIDTPLYKHEDKKATPETNLKPITLTAAKPVPSRPSSVQFDNPLIHKDQIAELAKNLKPIAITEPKPLKLSSNEPMYATPWKLKQKEDKESKTDTKIAASEEKSGEGVAVGVATTQDKRQSQVESEESIKQTFQKEQVGKESDRKVSASKSEPHYARPVVAAKRKESEGRVCENKKRAQENQYDKPVIAAKRKENKGQASANKGEVHDREYQYDTPVAATKREENKGQVGAASKQSVLEHEYDKPVVAAKPKKLQSKEDKGVDSGGKEEHKYHVLEGPISRNEKVQQEKKEDHEYHILEGPAPRKRSHDKNPDMLEGGGNVYHVLEGPTPRDKSDAKRRDKPEEEGGHVYHILDGPTLRDENSDRNKDKQIKENVYHVLEGPLPKDDNHSKNTEEQKRENIYHVLDGPTPIEENNS